MASVLVSELPADCSASQLTEYFEQEAGCVDSVSYLIHPLDGDQRQAIVAFRDSTAATYVSKCTHHIRGAPVTVTLRPREMFTRCVVQVDSLVLVTCTPHVEQCLKGIERDLGVTVDRCAGTVTLIGNLVQIESANYRLQKLWHHQVTRQERELEMITRETHEPNIRGYESKRRQSDDQNIHGHTSPRHQPDDQNGWRLAGTGHQPGGRTSPRYPPDDQFTRSLENTRLQLEDSSLREAAFLWDTDTLRDRQRARTGSGNHKRDSNRSHGARTIHSNGESPPRSPRPLHSPLSAAATGRRNMEEVLIRAIGGPAFDSDPLTGQRHQRDTAGSGRTSKVAWTKPGSPDYQADRSGGEIGSKPGPRLVTEPSARTGGQDASSGGRFDDGDYHGSGDDFHRSSDDVHRSGDDFRQSGDNFHRSGDDFRQSGDNFHRSGDDFRRSGADFCWSDEDFRQSGDNFHNRHSDVDPSPWLDVTEKESNIPSIATLLDRDITCFVQNVHTHELVSIENELHVTFMFKDVGDEMQVVISLPRPYDMLLQNLDIAHRKLDDIFKSVGKQRLYYRINDITHPQVEEIVSGVLRKFSHLVVHLMQPGELLLVGNRAEVRQAKDMLQTNIDLERRFPAEGATRHRCDQDLRDLVNGNGHLGGVTDERIATGTELCSRETHSKDNKKSTVSRQHSFRTGDSAQSKIPTRLWNTSPVAKKRSQEPPDVSHKSSNIGGNEYHFNMADGLNVIICDGDIVAQRVDVIVSAANGHLANYSGVAGAISRAAGRAYERDCIDYVTKHGPLSVTAVVPMAMSGPLSCTYVLHAVGPMWNLYVNKNMCSADLRRTFYNCLCAADDLGAVSMALPAISTGIFHVPTDVCAQSLVAALQQFVSERANDRSLETVRIVNLSSAVTEMFAIVLEQLLSADGRTVSWVDSAAPGVAAEHSGRRRHSAHGFGDSDVPQGVGDRIVSSSDSSPSGTKSVTRRPVNGNVSAERKSRCARVDDEVEMSSQKGQRSRPLSVDRQKDRHTTRRRCSSLDRRRGSEGSREEPECRSVRDSHKSHATHPHGSEQISKTLKQTLSRRKTSSFSSPMRPTKPPKKKAVAESPVTSESEAEKPNVQKSEICPICLDTMVLPKTLQKCRHRFCSRCIDAYFKHSKPICPLCGMIYGVVKGNQPEGGMMSWRVDNSLRVPGFVDSVGAIVIKYTFPDGFQQEHHPNPGQPYNGIERHAFLPNNVDGREVVTLLKKAFDAGLIFTISDSHTTGRKDVITWNDIHHKTNVHGGAIGFGYPDPTYIQRVKEELATKGVTSQDEIKSQLRGSSKQR